MKISLQTPTSEVLNRSIRLSVQYIHEWFVNTPERALKQAYEAVLTIQTIENEHFKGNKISIESELHSESVIDCFQADLDKNLNIARLRIAEFKISRLVVGNSDSKLLSKLDLIDDVIKRYALPENSLSPLSNSDASSKQLNLVNKKLILNEDVSRSKGIVPRSIGRTVNRIKAELKPNSEQEVITKFRSSSKKTKKAVRFLLLLVFVPLLTQQISKQFLIYPIVEQLRHPESSSMFFNPEIKESAFRELKEFEEEMRFEKFISQTPSLSQEALEKKVQHKAKEITEEVWIKGNLAISNVFADMVGVVAFAILIITSRKQIAILKSFIDDIVYGLSDSAKAFLIILFTDIFVGYHSAHGWEILLEGLANHWGIAADRNLIFFFIATFPVILDALFKYWIFRYLSQISPSAVATLKNMNE